MVWVSRIFLDAAYLNANSLANAPLWSDMEENKDPAIYAAVKSYKFGEKCPRSAFPEVMYVRYYDAPPVTKPLGDLFNNANYWFVSERCKNVLSEFNLGRTQFYPVKLLQSNRKTEFSGNFYHMNFASTNDAVLLDKSAPQRKFKFEEGYMLATNLEDDNLVVDTKSLGHSDLWIDPALSKSLFLSESLVSAIENAGMRDLWRLKHCKLV